MSETQSEATASDEIKDDQVTDQASTETEQNTPEQAASEPEKKPERREPDWYSKRINDMTRKLADEGRAREAAERRLAEREKQEQEDGERRYTAAELRAEAAKQAETIANQRMQESALQRIGEAGQTEYTKTAWNAACNTLADLGANDKPEFMALVAELPNGHAVLHQLGSDPDAAYRVLNMPAGKMALEIGRLSAAVAAPKAESAPKPPPVSKAPAPISPLQGRGTVVETDLSKMSTAEYMKKRGFA